LKGLKKEQHTPVFWKKQEFFKCSNEKVESENWWIKLKG